MRDDFSRDADFVEQTRTPPLTFATLRERNVKRCLEFYPMCYSWSAADWATALTGEWGEACNIMKKMKRAMDDADLIPLKKLADEFADVAIYLDLLAFHFGIDLEQAVREKFNETSRKRNAPYFL